MLKRLFTETFSRWSEHNSYRMAAALSYYTAFSLAPILIFVTAIAGFAFGREAAEGRLLEQLTDLVGINSAQAIQSMIAAAWQPSKGLWASFFSLIILIVGATGVLVELTQALNQVWDTRETGGVLEVVRERTKSLAMILGIGFLLMVSLAVSAALAALGKYMEYVLPFSEFVMQIINFGVSLAVITVLFAMLFKYLPNTWIAWRDVWIGALATALLFSLGKLLIGLYLGKSAVGSTYGTAGSVLIILMWVYYSALILYFGAEFTRVYAEVYGSRKKFEIRR